MLQQYWKSFLDQLPPSYAEKLSSSAVFLNQQLEDAKSAAFDPANRRTVMLAGVALGILILGALWLLFQRVRRARSNKKYREIARLHKERQRGLVEQFRKRYPELPKIGKEVALAPVELLVKRATSGQWKVFDIVLTYCHLAADAHDQLNCLTEVFFDEALTRAKELDLSRERKGVLFGVPISIKDSVSVKGYPSSVGLFKWKDETMEEDARVVKLLVSEGAIAFCKTNVPQTMMSFECGNPLWGTTENPIRKGFTPGGSSGGEAALIGAGGSVLGLGSDIAGSLRIPAHFSGICSLKPSDRRVPYSGARAFKPAPFLMHPVNGPMARRAKDLVPFFQACLGAGDIDMVPTQERLEITSRLNDLDNRKLKVGVLSNLPFLKALPSCTRAVEEASAALVAAGHSVVPFEFPFLVTDLVRLVYEGLSADGCHYYNSAIGDEPVEEIIKPFLYLMSKPKLVLRLFSLIASAYPDKRPLIFLEALGEKDGVAMLDIKGRRMEFIRKMNQRWAELGIDCLVMPAFACPANPHGTFPNISFAASYTFIWNLLDYVAGVVPVTKVDPEKDKLGAPHTEEDRDTSSSKYLLEAELEHLYHPEKMAGLPVGVQIITPQYQEVEALHAMMVLEEILAAKAQA